MTSARACSQSSIRDGHDTEIACACTEQRRAVEASAMFQLGTWRNWWRRCRLADADATECEIDLATSPGYSFETTDTLLEHLIGTFGARRGPDVSPGRGLHRAVVPQEG